MLGAARELVIDVPGELSVTRFDDLPKWEWADRHTPTHRSQGPPCVQLPVDAIAGRDTEPRRRRLHTTLIVRDSIAPPITR